MAMKLALVTLDIVDEILSVVLVTGVLRDGGEMKSPEIMLVVRGDGHRPVMKLIYIPTLVDVFSLSSVLVCLPSLRILLLVGPGASISNSHDGAAHSVRFVADKPAQAMTKRSSARGIE